MKILGLSVGVTSSAALMVDGTIIAAVSEERLNRIKNYDGFPVMAINECLDIGGITANEIDYVAWGGAVGVSAEQYITNRYCNFKVADLVKEQEEYWKPLIFDNDQKDFFEVFEEKINTSQFPGKKYLQPLIDEKNIETRDKEWRKLYKNLPNISHGFDLNKNVFLNHHKCHAAYAVNGMPSEKSDKLIFTLDGSGDGENATVWKYSNGNYEKLFGTSQFILGRYYRHATLILGMKMVEDEYKVMGLAPYGKPYHSDLPYKVYSNTFQINGLDVDFKDKPTDAYFYFKEKLKASRFDGIAAGVQRFVEDRVCEWINNWMVHTGIKDIALSGGVSMNIKTNMEIVSRCKPLSMIVPGSGSDESLAIGACYLLADKFEIKTTKIANLYLGTDIKKENVENLAESLDENKYEIIKNIDNDKIVDLLADGKILGRCCGRMEFGARAQGNRSIIADPRRIDTVQRLNEKIKNRDFWMPFAPSIIEERKEDYLITHNNINYYHMSVGAHTTAEGKKNLKAGLHPSDLTARPNIVNEQTNKEYYALIKAFEKKTGTGALLNTSLNVHGFPIVRNEHEAMYVLDNTDIDGMIIDNYFFLKKG